MILCNNRFAIPALRELAFFRQLAAVVIPSRNQTLHEELLSLPELKSLVFAINKKDLFCTIEKIIRDPGVSVCLVMSFPYRLDGSVLSLLPGKFFNFHFGPLPKYRGPEPVFAQLKNGETHTAVSVHRVTEALDAGAVCMEERMKINDNETYGSLQTRMAHTSATMVAQLLKLLDFGSDLAGREQEESDAGWSERPGMEEVFINWEGMNSNEIRNLVRACNPWNKGAGTRIGEMVVGILEVDILPEESIKNFHAGTIVSLNSGGLQIATKDRKLLKVNVVYCPEGFMSGQRLAEFGIKEGDRFF